MKFILPVLILTPVLHADLLYQTDFDDFNVGPNQWAANSNWSSNDTTSGAQAIDDDVLPALLKTASLGFAQPLSPFTTVFLNLNYDPAETGIPIVEIDTLLGIEDSTNNRRDDFFLTLYNSNGNRLASIRFDNQSPNIFGTQFGIWRENSTTQFDTLVDFIHGELFNLFARINLENNTWSADIDGLPLFDNAPFTDWTGGPLDLGFLAFEWDLTFDTTAFYGNNFLLVADLSVRSVNETPIPAVASSFDPSGNVTLTWQTQPGFTDQVQFSTNLTTWKNTLPNSTFTTPTPITVNFSDPSTPKSPNLFYRVQRSPAP